MSERPAAPEVGPLCEIWADVLGCPVMPDDHFVALGGNSIHAIRVLHRLEEHLGVEVPARLLLEEGTVRALVERLVGEGRCRL